jgi:hypothetical protein
MTVVVSAQRLPNLPVGEAFALDLPRGAKLLRAGIDPASGTPAVWFHFRPEEPQPIERRRFFVIEHMPPNDASHFSGDEERVTHCGMWWAASQTYHLFEIIQEEA